MAEDEFSVAKAAGERAGISIDAQNRGGNFRASLPHDEAPGVFTFRTFHLDFPEAADFRHGARWRVWLWNVAVCFERKVAARPRPEFTSDDAFQFATFQISAERFGVLIEIELDGVLHLHAARGRDALVAIDERGLELVGFAADVDAERDGHVVDDYRALPLPGDRLRRGGIGKCKRRKQ